MTPEENIQAASLAIWFAGFFTGCGFCALLAIVLIKIGFHIRRKP